MKSSLKILALIALCLSTQSIAATCDIKSANNNNQLFNNISGYVAQKLSNAEYECGIQAVEYIAKLSQTMDIEKGTDTRFELRNLALKLNDDTSIPVNQRFALLKAAASSTLNPLPQNLSILEFRYDALLFLKARDQYQQQGDTRNWLEALILSISLDQHLPDAERVTTGYLSFDPPRPLDKHVDQIVKLAKLTKHDKSMSSLRSKIAESVYYNISVWHQDDSKQEVLNQAAQTLELIDAMDDVKECYGCGAEWRWQLYMRVGTAYYRLGMLEKGRKYINQAIQIVSGISNPDHRLGTYRYVLSDMLGGAPSEHQIVLSVIQEMKKLANSLDTPVAKEERENIPKYLKNFGLEQ